MYKVVFTGTGKIAESYLKQFDGKSFSFRSLKSEEIIGIIENTDCLVHNSANLENNVYSQSIDDNFIFTKNLIDLCEKINPKITYIFISSMSILDLTGNYKNIKELGPYALSKFFAEIYCIKSKLQNLRCVRFSTIFYMDHEKDGLSKMIYNAVKERQINIYNGGVDKRDFIPIDVATQYLNKLITHNLNQPLVNICSGIETSFYEVSIILSNLLKEAELINHKTDFKENAVISKFGSVDINKLGIIRISLKDEIRKYIKKCMY